ncbi:MAG: sugar phosphate isomerase/epimerase [Planctomycetes bacterium]|nr:sugar phosphate isomerase/epimerase [Planctomycetota bacterium]
MKKCISYWSFEGGLDGAAVYGEVFKEAKAAGFEAVEPALSGAGELTLATTKSECEKIAADAKAAGVELSSLATGLFWETSLTAPEQAVRERALDIGRSLIERATWLGVDAVLVVPGAVEVFFLPDAERVPYDVCYERSLAAIKALAPVAEEHKVRIGLENVWNKFLLSPLEMRDFIDKIGSDYVGAYFDVGNVLLTGFPQDWIRILGGRLVRIHIKDFKTSVGTVEGFADLLEGDVPWEETMAALKAAGYDSYITAEMIPAKEGLIEGTSKAMDQIFSYL